MTKKIHPKSGRQRPPALSQGDTTPQGGLTLAQVEFCLHYLANGFNATAAYRSAHPGAAGATARTEGCRTLANPNIKARLRKGLGERWAPLHMSGDESLARVAMDARADPRLLVDTESRPLAVSEWPDDLANSVETVEFHADGGVKRVKFVSKAAARRTILEQTGKLKNAVADGIDALAEAIKADRKKHGFPPMLE